MAYEADTAAELAVRQAIAGAMDDFGQEAVGTIYGLSPEKSGAYKRTLDSSTYLDGELVAGRALRNIGVVGKGDIQTVVYSSSPLSWLLEFGTAPHYIPGWGTHPGSRRFPHFGPGALASLHSLTRVILAGLSRRTR